ncbi:MAG: hypothetical protein IPP40_13895 [bacterium]|nr:hypothetical protein [bacterium]
MNSKSYWAVVALLVLCFALVFSFGCDKEDDDTSPKLSITIENDDFTDISVWVVISDAAGEQILAAHDMTENSHISIDSGLPDRVTITFVRIQDATGFCALTTFANVIPQSWVVSFGFPASNGYASINIMYPEGEYEDLTVCLPSMTVHTSDVGATGTNLGYIDHFMPENNKLSIFGRVDGANSSFCGWVLDVPFDGDSMNTYDLLLDQPTPIHQITLSTPANYLSCYGRRNATTNVGYQIAYKNDDDSHTVFNLRAIPVPMNNYLVSAGIYDANVSYSRKFESLPSTVTIPQRSIQGTYDYDNGVFKDISFDGQADELWGRWTFDQDRSVGWYLAVSGDSGVIRRPVMPDSLWQKIQFDPSLFQPSSVGFIDITPCNGWNQYVRLTATQQTYGTNIQERYSVSSYDGFDGVVLRDPLERNGNLMPEFQTAYIPQ